MGPDMNAMKTIYTGFKRSVFDCGCFIYGSATLTHLSKLDVIQNKAPRLCIGADKSAPRIFNAGGNGRDAKV